MSLDKGNITTTSGADLNTAARRYAASQKWALADGSYPVRPTGIHGREDLSNAIHAFGRAPNNRKAAVKAHIKRRAAAIGATSMLPDHWQ